MAVRFWSELWPAQVQIPEGLNDNRMANYWFGEVKQTPYKGGPVVRTYFKGSIGIRCYPQDRGRPERAISQWPTHKLYAQLDTLMADSD